MRQIAKLKTGNFNI